MFILKRIWDIRKYKVSFQEETKDEILFKSFSRGLLNDMTVFLNALVNNLQQVYELEDTVVMNSSPWAFLCMEDSKRADLRNHRESVKNQNRLSSCTLDLLCVLTDDDVLQPMFLRDNR